MCTLCYIIPPHVLDHLAEHGATSETRSWANEARAESIAIRAARAVNAELWIGVRSDGLRRTIYSAQHQRDLPGKLARPEGARKTGDASVDRAYDGFGATYDFYKDILNRSSLDDHDLRLDGSVHYGRRFGNAFWDGRQMVFGDGDGAIFTDFTGSLDVIAHELTHGVIEYTANLRYYEQPGALNESFADIFGSLVRQRDRNERSSEADWLIGAEIMVPAPGRRALRSLAEPGTAYNDPELGKDPQPAHMDNYQDIPQDNGGVHVNSGIPNHAFYLAATALGGYAWDIAGQVWYLALTQRLDDRAQFMDAARATVDVAAMQFGEDVANTVASAWREVGVQVTVPVMVAVAQGAGFGAG